MKREIEGFGEVEVQPDFSEICADMPVQKNIQEQLVVMFEARKAWTADEVYVVVKTIFPWSTYAPVRAVADVRKFNAGSFKCQAGRPEFPVVLSGSGSGKVRGIASDAAAKLARI